MTANERSHLSGCTVDFRRCFEGLTGNQPFGWQGEFFNRLVSGSIPEQCDVPTGLGKTSVIAVWLLALARSLMDQQIPRKIPLRLVYVVDRRVVVDQSTDEARKAIGALEKAESEKPGGGNPLTAVAKALREAACVRNDHLVVLSPLRGQMAENRDWCLDPSRPAIVVGTVDMIGSRLLFSGYGGLGRSHRSLQAGLLGQDTLLVIDEAHLSPTFVATMGDIENQIRRFDAIRPFHVMSLSATLPSLSLGADGDCDQNTIFDERREFANPEARERLRAMKYIEWLYFEHPKEGGKKATRKDMDARIAGVIVERAIQYEDKSFSVIIFVSTVGLVNEIGARLSDQLGGEASGRILKMTGEMRGFERDRLVEDEKFLMFKPERDRNASRPTRYLIATSCAEVGVNLDADVGICDLSTLDSMIQRIGRINRFGRTSSTISVVLDKTAIKSTMSDAVREAFFKRKLKHIERRIGNIQKMLHLQRAEAVRGEVAKLKSELKSVEKSRVELAAAGVQYDKTMAHLERMERAKFYTWRVLNRKADTDGRIDCSPAALRVLSRDPRAWPVPPVRPPLDSARLDDWSMTSFRQNEFRRPLVAYWLRGVLADQTSQTTLCWRAELDHAASAAQAADMARLIPVAPGERAVVATYRAEIAIREIAKHSPDRFIVLIDQAEEYRPFTMREFNEMDTRGLAAVLAYATIIIPCAAGGLGGDGTVFEKMGSEPIAVRDVVSSEEWARYVLQKRGDGRFDSWKLADFGSEVEPKRHDSLREALAACADESGGICVNVRALFSAFGNGSGEMEDEEGNRSSEQTAVAFFLSRKSSRHFLPEADDFASVGMAGGRSIPEHQDDVVRYVKEIAGKIGLDHALVDALGAAGLKHDGGKNRDWWQAAIGNDMTSGLGGTPLAKSIRKGFDHSLNQHYRHELGSLVEAEASNDLKNEPNRDLILHLIATHHGYARPHFPEGAFDRSRPSAANRRIVHETMRRFESLQRRYGWWQLAYLEAILKAADALASRDFSKGASCI